MITQFALVPSSRTCRGLDVFGTVLVAGFVALGLFVGVQLWSLAQLHQGLLDAASALETTGQAIRLVGDLPLVGESARRLAEDVTAAAGDVRADALVARDGLRSVAVGVGTTIALLGLLPVAGLYVPLRLARRRELRGLRRMLSGPADPMLVEHLARVAVRRVPYAELRRVSTDPWRDLERGRHRDLASAELRRLGVPTPAGWSEGVGTGHG